nr:class E sortase [Streptomyces indicus]
MERLDDPLNDPLPGQHPSPWFRASATGTPASAPADPAPAQARQEPQQEWYDPEGFQRDWYGAQGPQETSYGTGYAEGGSYGGGAAYGGQTAPYADPSPAGAAYTEASQATPYSDPEYTDPAYTDPISQAAAQRPAMDASAYEAMYDRTGPAPTASAVSGETVSLGGTVPPAVSGQTVGLRRSRDEDPLPATDDQTVGLRTSDTRRSLRKPVPGLSRLEARRAERAKKPSPAVLASRALGEVFISIGVLMLLFVTYQLWWTNIRAEQQAGAEADKIQENWAKGKGKPGAFEPGQGFALMHIPKLDVVVPIAEGISKPKVLDRGMVGHYGEESIKTAMPEDKQGNFAVAGHRNTHGEPFRYINKLKPGDPIVVETQNKYYVYKMASILPQTTPDNVAVLDPVPKGSGFTKPGRYITLTTCTPEFTSTYRMIVWGELAEERPREKGKPPALVE